MTDKEKTTKWRTSLTRISEGKIEIRGVDVTRLMTESSFADAIYLLLKGERPSPAHSRMMNAVLTGSLDHGLTPPSALAARAVMSGGNSLNAAVAGGVLAIGDSHGGAIEACARLLQEHAPQGDPGGVARALVADFRSSQRRLPGFGHRLHGTDPRTRTMLELAEKEGMNGKYVHFATALEEALHTASGRKFPLNVDGAIAAMISEMGFDWRLGKGFFIVARTPGLVAHAFEEWSREKPMRKLTSFDAVYDGPEDGD